MESSGPMVVNDGYVSENDTELRLVRVADAYLRGVPQSSIATAEKCSPSYIVKLLGMVRERWKESAQADFSERLALEIAKIDALEREYWQAWLRSQQDQVTTEAVKETDDGATMPAAPTPENSEPFTRLPPRTRLHARTTKKGQVGQVQWLQGIQWCIQTRLTALGVVPSMGAGGPTEEGRALAAGSLDSKTPEQRATRLRAMVSEIVERAEPGGAQ